MKKEYILSALIIIGVICISGCIQGPLSNINNKMNTLSDDIINGDNNFNEAVNASNSKNYDLANDKIKESVNRFNDGENQIIEMNNYESELNESIYIQYINLVKEEIKFKKNASENLQLAIKKFEENDMSSGNSYIDLANSNMDDAVIIQEKRETIVTNYPDKFKNSNFF